jgi:predicted secreted Zn-dependent protease
MKRLSSSLILLLAISFGTAFLVNAEDVELSRKWKLYQINGHNQSELRRELNSRGPVNPDSGKRFDARTDWKLGWEYKYEMKQGKYRLSSHSIRIAATIHFPEWADMKTGNPQTQRLWLVYIHNLKRHEMGHVELAQRAGKVLSDRLSQLGTFNSRLEIEEAIKKKAKEVTRIHKALHQDYDRRTNHGKVQGARFP